MAGTSRALAICTFSGLRVAHITYVPAHSKNGRNVSARARISAFMNIASRANNGEGRKEPLVLIAWGKLADVCARACSKGKEINIIATPHVYDGRVYHGQQPVQMTDGTVLTTKKVSFTIDRITFGEESNETIQKEIQQGLRPQFWNVPGHPDYDAWRAALKQRNAVQYDGASNQFGYAEVQKPQGPGIGAYNTALDNSGGFNQANTGLNSQVAQAVAGAQPGAQMAFQPQPNFAPAPQTAPTTPAQNASGGFPPAGM